MLSIFDGDCLQCGHSIKLRNVVNAKSVASAIISVMVSNEIYRYPAPIPNRRYKFTQCYKYACEGNCSRQV